MIIRTIVIYHLETESRAAIAVRPTMIKEHRRVRDQRVILALRMSLFGEYVPSGWKLHALSTEELSPSFVI